MAIAPLFPNMVSYDTLLLYSNWNKESIEKGEESFSLLEKRRYWQ
jgi:hypothetical protein